MRKELVVILLFLITLQKGNAQNKPMALTFEQAAKQGISYEKLDSIYVSAIHADTSKAAFKTEAEQSKLFEAYTQLLKTFGKYLTSNNFSWNAPTKCFNRIYMKPDGSIDYFLYHFISKPGQPEPISEEKRIEFERLLNRFIQSYKFGVTASTKFAQCSPVSYGQ